MTRTPKETFLKSGHREKLAELVASDAFNAACDYALLEMQSLMPPTVTPGLPTDGMVAADANSQMWGARRVIQLLKTLADPIQAPEPSKQKTLYH